LDINYFFLSSARTAVGKAKRGSFKDLGQDKLLIPLFKDLLAKTRIDPNLVGDIVIGNVLTPGSTVKFLFFSFFDQSINFLYLTNYNYNYNSLYLDCN
jgi:hypothetical protein